MCEKHSSVCSRRKKRMWKFHYMPPGTERQLNFSDSDKEKIRKILCKRLGRVAVYMTRKQTSTQKTESVNHAYGRTNPKDVTWSRNASARIASAIHLVNNGTGTSILSKCEAAKCPLTPNSTARKAAKQLQRLDEYQSRRSKRLRCKTLRAKCRHDRYKMYYERKNICEKTLSNYKSGQLDPKTVRNSDHTYNKLPAQ